MPTVPRTPSPKPTDPLLAAHLTDATDRPLTLHGPVMTRLVHFRRLVLAALVVLALGNGFALWQIREATHRECLSRNARSAETSAALGALAAAHAADGNVHAAKVWASFLTASRRNPQPACR